MHSISLVFWVLCGIAGYREAVRFQLRYGRSPFGWSPITWGVICGLFFLLGLVLLAIGERIQRGKPVGASYGVLPNGSPAQGQHVYGYAVPGAPAPYGTPAPYGAPQP